MTIAAMTIAPGSTPGLRPGCPTGRYEADPEFTHPSGGRRSGVVPLVCEAWDWEHGVFLGSSLSSETTAAAAEKVGRLRRDPTAFGTVRENRLEQSRADAQPVRLDLSLGFMNSTGIHLLISAFKHARADGWQLEVDADLSGQVEQLFTLTDVERITTAAGSTTNCGCGKSVVA